MGILKAGRLIAEKPFKLRFSSIIAELRSFLLMTQLKNNNNNFVSGTHFG